MNISEIENYINCELKTNSEKKLAEFVKKLSPNISHKFLGVRIPILRSLSKKYSQYINIVDICKLKVDSVEKVLIKGLLIAYSPYDIDIKFQNIFTYLNDISSWCECDSVALTFKSKSKEIPIYKKFIIELISSNKTFYIRFAVILLMINFYKQDDLNFLKKQLLSINNNEFYVSASIAWCLCHLYFKHKGAKCLKSLIMDIVANKAEVKKILLQKIKDSNRSRHQLLDYKFLNSQF
ncbi:MAG: DNA alkylation repair protein [Succinivibrionaceae bacterium]